MRKFRALTCGIWAVGCVALGGSGCCTPRPPLYAQVLPTPAASCPGAAACPDAEAAAARAEAAAERAERMFEKNLRK